VLRFIGVVAAVSLMTGCIGDEEEETDSATVVSSSGSEGGSEGGSSDPSLTISGTPPLQVLVGTPFSFTPTVDNPDGVSLSFSAANLPGWASINGTTGVISGTPGAGDVGTHNNITVTVSGGGASDTSPAMSIEVVAISSGTATLSWVAPTQNTDGSPLTNLAGYTIHWGQSPSNLNNSVTINNAGITTYFIDQLTPATWYFATSAFDGDGDQSDLSNVASKTIT